MIVVINDTLGAYGGTHTLTLRICKWLEQNGYKSVIFCESKSNCEILEALEKNQTRIFCFDTADTRKSFEIVEKLKKIGELKIINYMWDKYLDMEELKYKNNISFDNILYCVHYGTFMKGATYPSIFRRIVKSQYYNIFQKMNRDNAIVMMDEDTTEKTSKWFNTECIHNTVFARIPMICEERQDAEEIIGNGFDSNIIMSASRAEFPYKGYQIGLIKEFARLKSEIKSLKLVMISGGNSEDIRRLTDEIQRLPLETKRDVEFHNWMDYDELKLRMEKCKLFIGMGTSVLDAGLMYKPAIPVKYNTYEVISSHMLSEKPEVITSIEDCNRSATGLIMKILSMSKEDYREEAYKTFSAIKNCYDIEKNMRVMLNSHPIARKSILNIKDITLIHLLRFVSQVRHRGNKMFDVIDVERD